MWKNTMENNIQKLGEDIARLTKDMVDTRTLKVEFDQLAIQMRGELQVEVDKVVKVSMGAMQPLPDHEQSSMRENEYTKGANFHPRQPVFFQKPPRYREGEDPETFILFYELLANGNQWSDLERAQRLPTYFPLSMLPWYISLDDSVKFDFQSLKRFDLASDKQQLLIDYHDLRAKHCPTLSEYAAKVQRIGLKLNKSAEENLLQFKLGLPVPTFRWIQERCRRTIETALRLAMDFDAMFVNGGKQLIDHVPLVPELTRQEVPMEHGQRVSPAAVNNSRRGGAVSRYPNGQGRPYHSTNVPQWRNNSAITGRNEGQSGNFRNDYTSRSANQRGQSGRGAYTSGGQPHAQGARRDTTLRHYQLEDDYDQEHEDHRDERQEDVEFTAEWFKGMSGN